MPDTAIKLIDIIIGGAAVLFTGLWGLLAWNGNRLVNRVDKHDTRLDEKVDRTEYNQTIESIRTDIKESFNKVSDKIDATHREQNERLDRLTESVHTRRRGDSQE